MSLNIQLQLLWLKDKSQKEIYDFSISWKLTRITFQAAKVILRKRASHTNKGKLLFFKFFFHFSSFFSGCLEGAFSWLKLRLSFREVNNQRAVIKSSERSGGLLGLRRVLSVESRLKIIFNFVLEFAEKV